MTLLSPRFKTLPPEIINRIFMYLGSPTAILIRESPYYQKSLPFLLLNVQRYRRIPRYLSSRQCIADYQQDIYWTISNHLHPEDWRRIELFYIHSNTPRTSSSHPRFSEDIGFNFSNFYTNYMLSTSHYYRAYALRRHHWFIEVFSRQRFHVPDVSAENFIGAILIMWFALVISYTLFAIITSMTA